jgi:hypothetical protein
VEIVMTETPLTPSRRIGVFATSMALVPDIRRGRGGSDSAEFNCVGRTLFLSANDDTMATSFGAPTAPAPERPKVAGDRLAILPHRKLR